jgi:DNA repair photolyase
MELENLVSISNLNAPTPNQRPSILVPRRKRPSIGGVVSSIKFNGPLSGPLWLKANSVKSAYPDTFDYSIYDQLQERYPADKMRGGVIFKSAMKLANFHPNVKHCHFSFEIDTYGRGCIHNCAYCYAKETLTRYGYWNRPIPAPFDVAEIRKIFATVFESDRPSQWREVLSRRIPLRIGSMSDSFMKMDKVYKVTKELLKILKYYNYPYVIFTRSDLVADDEYMDVMDQKLASIQMSISSINDTLNKKVEPGAPGAKARLKALGKLSQNGFWTTVRINPLFLMHPDGYFTDPTFDRKNAPHLDLFSWDIVDAVADHRIPALLAGVVRLNPVALKQFSNAVGVDYSKFFKPEVLKKNGDKHFSDREVAYYYQEIKKRASTKGVGFTTCYIGNDVKHYSMFQNLWDNKKDCCNAVGNVAAFTRTAQDIPLSVRLQHAPSSVKLIKGELDNGDVPTEWRDDLK